MMRGRGRGVRPGAVRIKVERVASHNQDGEESGGTREDQVVFVTQCPPCILKKKRKPKTPPVWIPVTSPSRLPPQPLPQRYARPVTSNEVIYVTAGRGRPQYVIPPRNLAHHPGVLQPLQRPAALGPHVSRQRLSTICAPTCSHPVRYVVPGVPVVSQTVVNVNNPVLASGVQRISVENNKIDWPVDLQELVSNWDNLPERRTRDVVKWFQTVSSNCRQPKIVCEIREMWASMPETWEQKVDLALEWLDGEFSKSSPQPSSSTALSGVNAASSLNCVTSQSNDVTLPSNGMALPSNSVVSPLKNVVLLSMNRAKVLVEAQPAGCGQWSSMADNRDNSSR